MLSKKLYYVGNVEAGKPLFVGGYDVTAYDAEDVYEYRLGKKRRACIKDAYIKAIQLNVYDHVFFGERQVVDVREIYALDEKYRVRFQEKYTSYLMHIAIEERLKHYFAFLFDDYGFVLKKHELGNAVDKNGKFFFYGPLTAYCMYNDDVCLNILYLAQRQDYDLYITEKYDPDQIYIRNGFWVDTSDVGNFRVLSENVKRDFTTKGEIYGYKAVNKK